MSNTKADNFFNALKDNPEEIIRLAKTEIREYQKLIELVRKKQQYIKTNKKK